jgi:BspA type Leucine rich repeat region (6 copies)
MNSSEPFLYTGQSMEDIPRDVTHVKVDPAVKVIGPQAFDHCHLLSSVELCEGLERIEQGAFRGCTSLTQITIPQTVKEIGTFAFDGCNQLINVELPEGLESIHEAFGYCTSLTSIRIPSTVKWINGFTRCTQLRSVELCEGLESIGTWAFDCTSLVSIRIPSTVKEIGSGAFECCDQLRSVELIDDGAFDGCTSLTSIRIPSTVKRIRPEAFRECTQLMNVELLEGLERIDSWAFTWCTMLANIIIPSTVNYIGKNAFNYCSGLIAVEFCEEIEQFVTEVSLPWWNRGVSKASLMTYSFLARRNIPARLGRIKAQTWKINIHDMLQSVPAMIPLRELRGPEEDQEEREELGDDVDNDDDYFNLIESQLSNYEYLQEVAPFLELALWRAKIMEHQSNGNISNVENEGKLMCRTNSFSMLAIIFPNVISFLLMNRKMPSL